MALVVAYVEVCGYKNTSIPRIAAALGRAHIVIITSHNSLTLGQKGETILIPTAAFFYPRILIRQGSFLELSLRIDLIKFCLFYFIAHGFMGFMLRRITTFLIATLRS